MAIKPKQIIDTAVGLGHEAVTRGVKLADRLRKDDDRRACHHAATLGPPTTVGAPKPGAAVGGAEVGHHGEAEAASRPRRPRSRRPPKPRSRRDEDGGKAEADTPKPKPKTTAAQPK